MEETAYKEGVDLTSRDAGEVSQEVVRMRSLVERLQRNYSVISELLNPVLKSHPEDSEKNTHPTPVLVPLADSLHDINEELSYLHTKFTELGDRISL